MSLIFKNAYVHNIGKTDIVVDNGIIIPAPIPNKALTRISCSIVEHTKYNAPLKRNRDKPIYNNLIYPTLSLI